MCHGTLFPLPHRVIDVSQGFCEHSLESAHGDPPHVSHLQRGLRCRSVPAIVIAAISVIAKLRTLSYSLANHGISKSPPEPLCSCSQLKTFTEKQQGLWWRSVPAIVIASIDVIAKLRTLSYCRFRYYGMSKCPPDPLCRHFQVKTFTENNLMLEDLWFHELC